MIHFKSESNPLHDNLSTRQSLHPNPCAKVNLKDKRHADSFLYTGSR